MIDILLLFEPVSFGRGMLMMAGLVLIIFGVIGIGSYVFIRVFAVIINRRRDNWESAAGDLKLTVDRSGGIVTKNMTGKRGDRSITVKHFAVKTGKYSSDDYAAVEVAIREPVAFSFEITKPELFYQRVANLLTSDDEIGHESFDKAFKVECSDTNALMELLNVEMLDGENSTLIGDLMAARRKYYRINVTDRSVCFGVRADIGDSTAIEPAIQRAINVADRFETAIRKIRDDRAG